MATKRIHLKSQEEALMLFGQNDQYLRELERRHKVQFFLRPSSLPSGEGLTLAMRGRAPDIDKVMSALELRRQSPQTAASKESLEVNFVEPHKDMIVRTATGGAVLPRTANQRAYV